MANFQASVLVSLRPSVLDPAGEAARSAASRLGIDGIRKLRIGKSVLLEIDASDALGVAICHGMTLNNDPDSLKVI